MCGLHSQVERSRRTSKRLAKRRASRLADPPPEYSRKNTPAQTTRGESVVVQRLPPEPSEETPPHLLAPQPAPQRDDGYGAPQPAPQRDDGCGDACAEPPPRAPVVHKRQRNKARNTERAAPASVAATAGAPPTRRTGGGWRARAPQLALPRPGLPETVGSLLFCRPHSTPEMIAATARKRRESK